MVRFIKTQLVHTLAKSNESKKLEESAWVKDFKDTSASSSQANLFSTTIGSEPASPTENNINTLNKM